MTTETSGTPAHMEYRSYQRGNNWKIVCEGEDCRYEVLYDRLTKTQWRGSAAVSADNDQDQR